MRPVFHCNSCVPQKPLWRLWRCNWLTLHFQEAFTGTLHSFSMFWFWLADWVEWVNAWLSQVSGNVTGNGGKWGRFLSFAKANVPRRNGELRLSNQFSNPVAVGSHWYQNLISMDSEVYPNPISAIIRLITVQIGPPVPEKSWNGVCL